MTIFRDLDASSSSWYFSAVQATVQEASITSLKWPFFHSHAKSWPGKLTILSPINIAHIVSTQEHMWILFLLEEMEKPVLKPRCPRGHSALNKASKEKVCACEGLCKADVTDSVSLVLGMLCMDVLLPLSSCHTWHNCLQCEWGAAGLGLGGSSWGRPPRQTGTKVALVNTTAHSGSRWIKKLPCVVMLTADGLTFFHSHLEQKAGLHGPCAEVAGLFSAPTWEMKQACSCTAMVSPWATEQACLVLRWYGHKMAAYCQLTGNHSLGSCHSQWLRFSFKPEQKASWQELPLVIMPLKPLLVMDISRDGMGLLNFPSQCIHG